MSHCYTKIVVPHPGAWLLLLFVSPSRRSSSSTRLAAGDAKGDYYGESAGSYMVKEFKYVVLVLSTS